MDSPPLGIFPEQVVLTEVLHIITMVHHAQITIHQPGGIDLRTAENKYLTHKA